MNCGPPSDYTISGADVQQNNDMKSSGHSSHIGQICDQSMRNLIITKKYRPPSLHSPLPVLEMVERDMA